MTIYDLGKKEKIFYRRDAEDAERRKEGTARCAPTGGLRRKVVFQEEIASSPRRSGKGAMICVYI